MRSSLFRAGAVSLAILACTAAPTFAQTPTADPSVDVCSVIPQDDTWMIATDQSDQAVTCVASYLPAIEEPTQVDVVVTAYGSADEAREAVAVVDPSFETASGLYGEAGKEQLVPEGIVVQFSRGPYVVQVYQVVGPESQVREAARQLDLSLVMAGAAQPPAVAQAPTEPTTPTTPDTTGSSPTTARPSVGSIVPEEVLFTNASERAEFTKYVGVGPDRVLSIAREWSSPEQFAAAVTASQEPLQQLAFAAANPGDLTQNEMDALSWMAMNKLLGSLIDRTNQPFSPSLNSSAKALDRLGNNAYKNPEVLAYLRSLSGSLIKKDLTMNGMLVLP